MTDEEFAELKGRVGRGTRSRNAVPAKVSPDAEPGSPPSFTFTLSGQIRGGKNSIKTTRTGKRYPTKRFEKWRDEAVSKVSEQVRTAQGWTHWPWFKKPIELCIEIHYAAGDLRRRDIPGMMDSLFHVLERAQVVEDDAQIKEGHWYQLPLDRASPGVRVVLKPKE